MDTQMQTIVFVIRDGKILLAKKKRGPKPLVGKWNGYGGKVEISDKTFEEAVAREFEQETGGAKINPKSLTKVAEIEFRNGKHSRPLVHIFIVEEMTGFPVETDEAGKPVWFPLDQLPSWDEFAPCDKKWIPSALVQGYKLKAIFVNNDDFEYKAYDIEPVESF